MQIQGSFFLLLNLTLDDMTFRAQFRDKNPRVTYMAVALILIEYQELKSHSAEVSTAEIASASEPITDVIHEGLMGDKALISITVFSNVILYL